MNIYYAAGWLIFSLVVLSIALRASVAMQAYLGEMGMRFLIAMLLGVVADNVAYVILSALAVLRINTGIWGLLLFTLGHLARELPAAIFGLYLLDVFRKRNGERAMEHNDAITLPTAEPLGKVTNTVYAGAASAIIIALLRRYVFPDLTPDLEFAVNIITFGAVSALASFIVGYNTKIKANEARAIAQAAREAASEPRP